MNDPQKSVVMEFIQSPPGKSAVSEIKALAEMKASRKLDDCQDAAMAAVHLAHCQGAIWALDQLQLVASPKQENHNSPIRPKRAINTP